MHEEDLAIIRGLVPVAWADGVFAEREKATIFALLEAFQATEQEKESIVHYAEQKRSLDDIRLQELSADDRRVLLQHAVLLSFSDGEQSAVEKTFLEKLASHLKIPADEGAALISAAEARAKKHLKLL